MSKVNRPMVKWEATVDRMTTAEKMAEGDRSAMIAERHARWNAYISRRLSGGKHYDAVKAQNRAARKVRQALGYTYADDAFRRRREMPTTHTVTAYTFDELSPEAKERARTWMRDCEAQDWDPEYVLTDAAEICELLGIDLNTHAVKLHGGGTRHDPDIFYSGFYSQGDGASFTGTYAHKVGSVKAITTHAPQESELHRIARELADLQKTYAYKLRATIRRISSQYSHEHTVCVDAELDTEDPGWTVTPADEETLTEALRDLMRWIYKALQQEYEYRLEDAQIDEGIRANEYAFTADGKRSVIL